MENESIFKSLLKLTKHSLIYGIGHVLSRSIGLILLPIYTNYIPPEEMGIAAILFLFLAFMTIVYQLGFAESFLRYFSLTTDTNERKKIFSNAYLSIFFITVNLSVLIFLFSKDISQFVFHSPQYSSLILMCIGVLVGDVLSQIPLLILRVEEKSVSYLLITLLNILINIALNIYFIIHLKHGLDGIFLSNLYSSLLLLIIVSPIIFRYSKFNFSIDTVKFLFIFGFPYMFSGISKIILDLADRFILERLTDLKTVGIYNASYKLGTIMGIIVAGFRFAWSPYSLSISTRADAKKIYAKVMTYFLLICGFIFIFVSFFLELGINLKIGGLSFLGKQYLDGIIIIPHILFSYILFGVYSILLIGVFVEKKSSILPLTTGLGAIANIFGNYLLIPYLGIIGAAIVTVFSYLVMVISLYFYIQKYYYIQFEYIRILKLVLSVALLFLPGYFYHGNFYLMLRFGLVIVFPVMLYVVGFFEAAEIDRAKIYVRYKFRFKK